MAENITVARPYAEAVFKLALEEQKLDEWQNMLCAMSEACSNQYYLAFLKNSSSSEDASEELVKLLKDLLTPEGENFVRVLGTNGRFEVLPQIYELFTAMRNAHDKLMDVELISARKFAPADLEPLKAKLSQKYGCSINLHSKIDPSLIGGAVLKIGDKVIDASLKTSLTELSSTLR
ncbi:MAG: F0F1 ATP synthase subunit delta [Succinivibrio sp.]|jgi:F-type H+-transporting ATPase subunit delta|nr:F0F1 ATP synthase subunit delta [Succinivibrio sp.]